MNFNQKEFLTIMSGGDRTEIWLGPECKNCTVFEAAELLKLRAAQENFVPGKTRSALETLRGHHLRGVCMRPTKDSSSTRGWSNACTDELQTPCLEDFSGIVETALKSVRGKRDDCFTTD